MSIEKILAAGLVLRDHCGCQWVKEFTPNRRFLPQSKDG